MEDKRFQALRPIEKSWMYGNLSALRDCLEQAYDLGHAATSQAELDKITQDRDEYKEWTRLYKHGCEKAERENDELKAKIATLEKLCDKFSDGNTRVNALLVKAERERDQAREALRGLLDEIDGAEIANDDPPWLLDLAKVAEESRKAIAAVPPSEDAPATPQPETFRWCRRYIADTGQLCALVGHKYCEPAAQPAGKQPKPDSFDYYRGKLEQFLRMKGRRPIDPTYWDMHEERALREGLARAESLLKKEGLEL